MRKGGWMQKSDCKRNTVFVLYVLLPAFQTAKLSKATQGRRHRREELRGDETFQPDFKTEGQIFMVETSFCHIKDGISVCQTKELGIFVIDILLYFFF